MTKEDLEFFRQLIQAKLAELSQEFHEQELNSRSEAEQVSSEDRSAYSLHMADRGTDAMEREKMLLFASKEGRYLYRVEEALRRLYKDPASFGVCQSCEQRISFERLDALPHARYCIDCKLKEEADAA